VTTATTGRCWTHKTGKQTQDRKTKGLGDIVMATQDTALTQNPPQTYADRAAMPRATPIVTTVPWYRLALGAVLALAAALNLWALDRVGYANGYYAAAVKSMLQSWHNFFFVSFDPGGFVTIDKPPLGFWIETASAKLFGFSGVSLLLPEALAGVLSVAVLYRLVARAWGRSAGLLAALFLAVTPVSVVTSRNNTIDSLLVLMVLLGAWAVTRAAETGRMRWLLACAVLVGLGFNIKMLQAYLVVPAFGLVYLWSAPGRLRRRIGHLALATVALLAVSLSWAVAVDLTPASLRPYVGSSGTNSELNLALGYNGLSRLLGGSGTPGGGGNGNALFNGGPAGLFRLLGTTLGGQVSWLLVLAVLGLAAAATFVPWRKPDARSRSLVLWGAWLLTAGAFFSVAEFFHPYYTVMLAPAIAAPAAIGVTALWRAYRDGNWRGWLLPLVLLVTAGVQAYLLRDYPAWSRWLTPLVLGAGLVTAAALVVARLRPRRLARVAVVAGGVAMASLLAAPTTWAAYSVTHIVSAGIPTAGPTAQSTNGAGGGFGGPGGGFGRPSGTNGAPSGTGAPPSGTGGGFGGPGGGPAGAGGPPSGANGGPGGQGSGPGGLGSTVNTTLIKYLETHQSGAKFLVATASSMDAESIIITTGKPVMALGGFSGSDQILTTAQLARLVANNTIHYFLIQGGGFGGPGGEGGNAALTQWITTHGTVVPASRYEAGSTSTTSGGRQATLYYVR
jgi:4-amino-4-deoxy-L-arabinose transferase-like glycosyltransferase